MAVGDALIVLSLLSLVFAIVYPRYVRSAYEDRIEQLATDVEALKSAAERHRERDGVWPAGSPTGTVPAELVGNLPVEFTVATEHYRLDWNLWETVSAPPEVPEEDLPDDDLDPGLVPPPQTVVERPEEPVTAVHPLPGITVHSDDPALLAALLQRHGEALSFVRDGRWTLILEGAS